MEEFVDNVKILINALGYKVLEPILQQDSSATDDDELLCITTGGFVLLKGAIVNEKTSVKSMTAGLTKLREKHFTDGHIVDLVTTEDILFSSASAAALWRLEWDLRMRQEINQEKSTA